MWKLVYFLEVSGSIAAPSIVPEVDYTLLTTTLQTQITEFSYEFTSINIQETFEYESCFSLTLKEEVKVEQFSSFAVVIKETYMETVTEFQSSSVSITVLKCEEVIESTTM